MGLKEIYERNLNKEELLKELWHVSDNFLLGKLRHVSKGRYIITSVQKEDGEMLTYPNGQRVSILFVDKNREYKEGLYKFQWSIVNRKNPDVYKIKLSKNNIIEKIELPVRLQSKEQKASLNEDKLSSLTQEVRTIMKEKKIKIWI